MSILEQAVCTVLGLMEMEQDIGQVDRPAEALRR